MKLAELAAAPKLIQITIDDSETVEAYGEPVEFWVYDRQDMDTFMKLANVGENNMGEIIKVVNSMVRTEDGECFLGEDKVLPMDLMLKVIEEVVSQLGNPQRQTLEA